MSAAAAEGSADENVKVAVRCRPMNSKELGKNCRTIVSIDDNHVTIVSPDGSKEDKTFTFDHAYGIDSTQPQVYTDLGRPVVTQALDGFNGTIFAYGQTGSGKTHSMMGNEQTRGIIPQLNEDLWRLVEERMTRINNTPIVSDGPMESQQGATKAQFLITVSFLEVYNERVKDLLNPSDKVDLPIRENPSSGIYVDGLCELVVSDAAQVMRLIYQGNMVRHVAETQMNDQSSRSHSVFTIKIEQKISTEVSASKRREQLIKAKVNLVDLAGSERADKTGATGATLKEGAKINLSLSTLGNVINKLADGVRKGEVVPYRDSKLTRLLQESLGGNSRTVMLAAVSPADYNYSESMSTLRFAFRAKSIQNAVKKNEDLSETLIRNLQKQIEELKAQLAAGMSAGSGSGGHDANGGAPDPELLQRLQDMEKAKQDTWEEKERLSRELEAQRASNVDTIISSTLQTVKDQKVQHMKNIKRLTNERAMHANQMKKDKDERDSLKKTIDESIAKYQRLQQQFDAFGSLDGDEVKEEESAARREKEKAAERLAEEMIPLLTAIEHDRGKFAEKKESVNRLKTKLQAVEAELREEQADLLASTNILSANDKIRDQIRAEEKERLDAQFAAEMAEARQQLEKERLEERQSIQGEMQAELDKLTTKIKMLESLRRMEEAKTAQSVELYQDQLKYAEDLEQKLASSLAEKESAEGDFAAMQADAEKLLTMVTDRDERIKGMEARLAENEAEMNRHKKEMAEQAKRMEAEHKKELDEARFEIFAKMMDTLNEERSLHEARHGHTAGMLQQASRDIAHLAARNQELEAALNQAILYEPPINR